MGAVSSVAYAATNHQKIHIIIFTTYNADVFGVYQNWARTTLPGETRERKDEHHEFIGVRGGIRIYKTGNLNEDGKKIDYTVTMHVNEDISDDKGSGNYSGGAMITDLLGIGVGDNRREYFDLSEPDAKKITSVVATYEENGETINRFRVLFFNPELIDPDWNVDPPRRWTQVKGSWPDELAKHDVTVTFEYTIDPSKVYFVAYDDSVWSDVRKPYDECDTLAEYLEKHRDVDVYNEVSGTIKDDNDWALMKDNVTYGLVEAAAPAEEGVEPLYVSFDKLKYDKAGTYTYRIVEVNDKAEG